MARIPESIMPEDLVRQLEESGLTWELVRGKNHTKLLIEGRLCQVFTRSKARPRMGGRCDLNKIANIRRTIRSRLDERSAKP